jgi:hypothetical protein
MEWPTAFAIFLPPFAAVVGVWIGGRMARTTQSETLRLEARQRRLERFEHAIGETKLLLIDGDPLRVSMNFNPEKSPELIQELRGRWANISPLLEGAAVLDQDADLREALSELLKGVSGVLHWDTWIVSDMANNRSFQDALNNGKAEHETASVGLEQVGSILRSSE